MYNLIFLLSTLSVPSVILPPDPDLMDKPDTIVSYEENQVYGTFALKYNSDGYLIDSKYSGKSYPNFYDSYTGSYSRKSDTIIGTYSDTSVDKYVVDQNDKVIKTLNYKITTLQEIDSIIYNNQNKMRKIITKRIVPDTITGDSTVLTYDPNNLLKTSTVYGDGGTIWEYTEFEHDSKNRVSKAIYFDCESGCTKTNSYDTYHYSTSAVRRNIAIVNNNFYNMKVSTDMIYLTFYNGAMLNSLELYDLNGNKVKTKVNLMKNCGTIQMGKCAGQVYILHMNTSKGMISTKISGPEKR
jgi:hypothetical protein